MREAVFIRKNQEQWARLEEVLEQQAAEASADELSKLFIQVTDDLSYARTFYPDSQVTVYLNDLSARTHFSLYKNKKERKGRFFSFWIQEVPLAVAANYKPLIFSSVLFLFSVFLGWMSASLDENFLNLILGEGYVEYTKANINSGKPTAIYGQDSFASEMFLNITVNNIRVAFLAFAGGLLFGLGTFFLLVSNGIMVGAFLALFAKYQVFLTGMLGVFMHGTIEVTVIALAGGAGFTLTRGLLFPGTYTRSESMKYRGKQALKIMVGLIPFFIIAGFIEGLLTRFAPVLAPLSEQWPRVLLSLVVILLSLGLLLSYFVALPLSMAQENHSSVTTDASLEKYGAVGQLIFSGLLLVGALVLGVVNRLLDSSDAESGSGFWFWVVPGFLILIAVALGFRSLRYLVLQSKPQGL